jgi:hyaluronoglucosaminidase
MQTKHFPFRGVIEGFYGPMWSHEDRLDLIARMPAWSMNLYVYAPKTDPYHRFRWEVPYPKEQLRRFRELGDAARQRGVKFSLAISPGNSFRPEKKAHQTALLHKLGQFIDVGCTFFPIFYDDLHGFAQFDTPEAADHAERQAGMMNHYVDAIARRVPKARFLFCPTEYGTAEKSAYLSRLHQLLDPRVDVICTGVDGPGYQVFAKTITNRGAHRYYENFRRKPFVWDNFNTSDWTINALHWTPYQGRGDRLGELCSGILLNPQNLHRLNLPILATMGDWLADPQKYASQRSMKRQLEHFLGRPGVPVAATLSRWFTNEINGYISAQQNLPPLPENASATSLKPLLKDVRKAVAPLAKLRQQFDLALFPPEWSNELGAYSHVLHWWATAMLAVCDHGLSGARFSPDQQNAFRKKIGPLTGYGYQLPHSLNQYLEQLARHFIGD